MFFKLSRKDDKNRRVLKIIKRLYPVPDIPDAQLIPMYVYFSIYHRIFFYDIGTTQSAVGVDYSSYIYTN